MTQEAGTPADFWERVKQAAERAVDAYARSGASRNASISSGGTFTVRGGVFRLLSNLGKELFYAGPLGPSLSDGTPQQGLMMRRADDTAVLALFDAAPGVDGSLNQALNWFDRTGHVVFADDTNNGSGLARPYIGGGFGRARFGDMDVATTSSTFETLWTARVSKQHPRMQVWYQASMDTAATTGEVRVLVDGVQVGSVNTHSFAVLTTFIGPDFIAGEHEATVTLEIQGRRTTATGALRVEALGWIGKQS